MDYGLMGMINIDVSDLRTYQDLALLMDRQDFLMKVGKLRLRRLFGKEIDEKEIDKLINHYRYPNSLHKAISSAVFENRVTNLDVSGYGNYQAKTGLPKNYGHPILTLKLDKKIKQHRDWFISNKRNWLNIQLGYRKLSNMSDAVPFTTIQTAINTYKKNLNIKL